MERKPNHKIGRTNEVARISFFDLVFQQEIISEIAGRFTSAVIKTVKSEPLIPRSIIFVMSKLRPATAGLF